MTLGGHLVVTDWQSGAVVNVNVVQNLGDRTSNHFEGEELTILHLCALFSCGDTGALQPAVRVRPAQARS